MLLSPNGTHILQPFKKFGDLCLLNGKIKSRGCILKSEFLALLIKEIEKIENIETNIRSGFRDCGIIPLSLYAVRKKIPNPERIENECVNEEH